MSDVLFIFLALIYPLYGKEGDKYIAINKAIALIKLG